MLGPGPSLGRTWLRTATALIGALGFLALVSPGQAVQLPGVTPSLPPGVDRKFELLFGNDFLARGGEFDDFRTQQLGVVGAVARRWNLIVNHSILTLEDPKIGDPGRIDHLSGSVGYSLVQIRGPTHTQSVEVGGGFRYSSEIGGARIQNGFHQIVGSKPETLPYVDTDRIDGTLWLPSVGFRAGWGSRGIGVPAMTVTTSREKRPSSSRVRESWSGFASDR